MKTISHSRPWRAAGAVLLTGLLATGLILTCVAGKPQSYTVHVLDDATTGAVAPTYAPTTADDTCVATSPGNSSAFFPRHDLCAAVHAISATGGPLPNLLTDDIGIMVSTEKVRGQTRIVSLYLKGQDVIGVEGIMHVSEEIVLDEAVIPSPDGFVIPVYRDMVPIWKTDQHQLNKKATPIEIVGYISLDYLVYVPQQ